MNTEKVLFVANWESDVGYAWWLMESFWITIGKTALAHGLSSQLIYPKITRLPESVESSDINTAEFDYENCSTRKLIQLIRTNNIRYIYLSDKKPIHFRYLILRLFGVRKIVIHDHTPGDRPEQHGARKTLKSLIMRLPLITADRYIATSSFVADRLEKNGCIPRSKINICQNGIPPLTNSTTTDARGLFSIPEDRFLCVISGRASRYKGIDFIINCIKNITQDKGFDGVHFIICGDGPDLESFKDQAQKLKVSDHICFTGMRSDIRQWLGSCDIGIQASKGEVGYSLSILEYMSAGLATFTPDRPSTSLCIAHNADGIIYRAEDINDLSEKLISIMKSNDERLSISKKGQKKILEQYDIKQTHETLSIIFDKLLTQ